MLSYVKKCADFESQVRLAWSRQIRRCLMVYDFKFMFCMRHTCAYLRGCRFRPSCFPDSNLFWNRSNVKMSTCQDTKMPKCQKLFGGVLTFWHLGIVTVCFGRDNPAWLPQTCSLSLGKGPSDGSWTKLAVRLKRYPEPTPSQRFPERRGPYNGNCNRYTSILRRGQAIQRVGAACFGTLFRDD